MNGIIIYIFAFVILFILYSILQIRITYKPMFDWWISNGGNKYDVVFYIYSGYTSWIMYYLSKFKVS